MLTGLGALFGVYMKGGLVKWRLHHIEVEDGMRGSAKGR